MLAASDLGRAKRWYSEKLGFEPVDESQGVVLTYRSGDSTFSVYQTSFAGTAKNTVAVWRLVGLRDEVARLRGNGVEFEEYDFGEGEKTVGGILSDAEGEDLNAWFTDSEGTSSRSPRTVTSSRPKSRRAPDCAVALWVGPVRQRASARRAAASCQSVTDRGLSAARWKLQPVEPAGGEHLAG